MKRVAFAVVLALSCSDVLLADPIANFRTGVVAFRRRDWNRAITAFRQAIAEQPQDTGRNTLVGGAGDFEPYIPNYFLGAAYFGAGDCVNALAAWKAASPAGTKWAGAFTRDKSACETRVAATSSTPAPPPSSSSAPPVNTAALNQAIQRAEAEIARAEGSERAVGDLSKDPLLVPGWRGDARLGGAETRARDALAGARTALADARRQSDPKRAGDAAEAAKSAADQFDAVRQAATARRTELTTVSVRPVNPGGTTPPPSIPPTTTSARPVETRPRPPQDLVKAAALFFNAQYSEAASALGRVRVDSGPDALQAELFRAASSYSLYLIGGGRDQNLLNQARQSVRACKRQNARFTPDERVFSPRFVQFYRSTR